MKPEVTPDATTAKEAVALTAARLVSALDEEITSLERTDADSWWDMDFATAGYSFSSTREIETDGVTKLSSEEEFSAYIKEYCDIWSSAEDTWTVEADEFCFRHDIQSVQWYADGEEIITYFAMDCAELDPLPSNNVNCCMLTAVTIAVVAAIFVFPGRSCNTIPRGCK